MIKKFTLWSFMAALMLCCNSFLLAQETTGSIEVTVKDSQGAIIPNATVTISNAAGSATSGFRRTITTDASGSQRVVQIPPGLYDVTVAAISGFTEKTAEKVQVFLGRATPVNVELGVSGSQVTVDVNTSETNVLDTTSSSIQTSVSAQQAELIPKGLNFTSVLKVSPSTRGEAKAGGFQIDGASGAENTFVIDGQEVTNVRTGTLNGNSNLPFQLVQEVQIKSSGFQAEYGGATGGVINVVTKGGSNDYHGEFGIRFLPRRLAARNAPGLILNSTSQAEYINNDRDGGLVFQPSATLGGRIIKDRLWFFASATPQIDTFDRSITYRNASTRAFVSQQDYRSRTINTYDFLRLDAQPFSKLRLNAAYTYNPISQRGTIPTYESFLGAVPTGNGLSGSPFFEQTGGRQNSQSITGGLTYTATNNLIFTARAGHYFLNQKLGTYGFGSIATPLRTCSTAASSPGFPSQFPASFGCVKGQNNGVVIYDQTLFDATKRNTVDGDVTTIFNLGGQHQIKGGVQYNGIGNQLLSRRADVLTFRTQSVADYAGRPITPDPTAFGSGLLQRFGQMGDVSSNNLGFYVQDNWQPIRQLTLNLGIRTEREDVPSFAQGLQGIKFDFKDKIAPRLGGAFDITGNGKSKITAFYGWFYDRFKYELPRGSFGGNFFRVDYYDLLPGDTFTSITPALILGSSTDPIGGACKQTGFVWGRSRCQVDFRVPSNTGGNIVDFGGIDPDLKPFKQSEFSVGYEQEFAGNYLFSGRYVHKNVDSTVEDIGFLTPSGSESYVIGNPGLGLSKQLNDSAGIASALAVRQYDALELRVTRRLADNFYFDGNYTYSRLYGNYSGLASSDEDGRTSPNLNRFFDLPNAAFSADGTQALGRLATDRPHVAKFSGAYNLDWSRFGQSNNESSLQVFSTVQSGTPLTTFVDVVGITTTPLFGRGDMGRTPIYSQTDAALRHTYKFGTDGRFRMIADIDVLNVFNQRTVTNRYQFLSSANVDLTNPRFGLISATESATLSSGELYRLSFVRYTQRGAQSQIAAFSNAQKDARYNLASGFNGGRTINFGFRFVF